VQACEYQISIVARIQGTRVAGSYIRVLTAGITTANKNSTVGRTAKWYAIFREITPILKCKARIKRKERVERRGNNEEKRILAK
jgi:hypothetical protein